MTDIIEERGDDLLLAELHHRFYNSLQIIASGLSHLGRDSAAPTTLRSQLSGIADRIGSMASLHRALSRTAEDGGLEQHCRELCLDLAQAFGRKDVILDMSLADMPLSPLQQSRISLLIVELVTNSLKHSRSIQNDLIVQIELRCEDGMVQLFCRDNGVPLPSSFAEKSRIVTALAGSLGGSTQIFWEHGYATLIRFPLVRQPPAWKSAGRSRAA